MRFVFSPLLALALLGAPSAFAHITLEHQTAHAGSYYKANFKVGHGCGSSPIRQIVVQIPVGVQGAKPMPKPGWDLLIERAPLAQPYTDHGRRVTEDVVRISWSAKTPADHLLNEHHDEFALHAKLPAQPGPLVWTAASIGAKRLRLDRPCANSRLRLPCSTCCPLPVAQATPID
jgi:uncharacterized protein YcnI